MGGEGFLKTVISASRRTDMPACHLDWLVSCIRSGFAETTNPYSGRTAHVNLDPDAVHTIVLWSKDFGPFLRRAEAFRAYRLNFLFTVNDMPDLEPHIPPLSRRLDQVRELSARFGPERVAWRFDPVVFRESGPVASATTFRRIGETVASYGVRRAIFSFLDLYGKVRRRNDRFSLGLVDPPDGEKRAYAESIAAAARDFGMNLESCSEDMAAVEGITHSACIDGALLARLGGEPASLGKDSGQRPACRCTESRDIGSYRGMPCPHGCLYCYANPVIAGEQG